MSRLTGQGDEGHNMDLLGGVCVCCGGTEGTGVVREGSGRK